ncbi:unnamed protein product [Moneuplotes crassus]|uniref:Transmembrane protein n=1 Tax=Euplotes crassus TaxID=5936 RepID=A0AAD1XU79_EUPCR|nr:unnamed protein product [Moneuplotes crassus]
MFFLLSKYTTEGLIISCKSTRSTPPNSPWQKFRVLFISKRRDKCDTELRKYRFKRQTYRNLYWSLGGVVAALAFHYYYYKILIYENGQVADFGEEYPYYQPSIISMWGHKIRRVRDLFVFSLRYHSASQDYTDNLNQNVVNPVFFEIYKYKRMLKWYRFRDMRDTSFDFMDIGEDMFDQVDDGL